MIDTASYRVAPGAQFDLREWPTRKDGGLSKAEAKEASGQLSKRLSTLQRLLRATRASGLLVVLQAMDAAGKNSTTRRAFQGLGPTGVQVTNFQRPNRLERRHDFLWRVHRQVPPRGDIAIFNRSHYEDVTAARVQSLELAGPWQERFYHINAFERLLTDEGTIVLKFYLHISKEYQKKRLRRRLERHDKHWKFSDDDMAARAQWDRYLEAYDEAIGRCSTEAAPWYVVPAERRWFRDLLVLQTVVERLEALQMRYPPATFDRSKIQLL